MWRFMDIIYQIIIYVIVILFVGLYLAYVIDRSAGDVDRIIIARRSILKDLTKIAEDVEENNRLLAEIIEYRKRRCEYVRK